MTATPSPTNRPPDRVQLLLALAEGGPEAVVGLAAEMGFAHAPRRRQPSVDDSQPPSASTPRSTESSKQPDPTSESIDLEPVRFWRPVAREYRETLDGSVIPPAEASTLDPVQASDLEAGDDGAGSRSHDSIVAWPRLWRALDDRLRTPRPRRMIDVDQLVKRWARGETIRALPCCTGLAQASVTVVLDTSDRLMPFWRDQLLVLAGLVRKLGRLNVRRVEATSLLDNELPPLAADECVLAMTDLGCLASAATQRSWVELGARLGRRGLASPMALVTVPEKMWPRAAARHWHAVEWQTPNRQGRSWQAVDSSGWVEAVLVRAAMAQRLEAGLMRGLRRQVGAGLETEVALWRHPDVAERQPTSLVLDPAAVKRRRAAFIRLPAAEQAVVLALLQRWHQDLPEVLAAETVGLLECGPDVVNQATAQAAIELLARVCRRVAGARSHEPEFDLATDAWFGRLGQWASLEFWREPRLRADLEQAVKAHGKRYPNAALPTGVTSEVLSDVAKEPLALERWHVVQRADGLLAESSRFAGSPIVEMMSRKASVVFADGLGSAARSKSGVATALPISSTAYLTTDVEAVALEPWQPILDDATSWASAAGRDEYGLWAALEVEGVRQRLRWISPGRFWMGSPDGEEGRFGDEGPRHPVTLTEGFWLAETPCTQALWRAVMGSNPSGQEGEQRPVESVSWDDCQLFVDRLNERFRHLDVRLPTEAEWEYACRAGTEAATWRGDLQISEDGEAALLNDIAWYARNSEGASHEVGSKKPNPWGLYDLLGNVDEWCWDVWRGHYSGYAEMDPEGSVEGSKRVLRGGSWGEHARVVRAAYRYGDPPGERISLLGFRLSLGRGPVRGAQVGKPVSTGAGAARGGTTRRAGSRRSRAWLERLGWASDGGLDHFGRWASFEVGGVETRLRWIVPGHFQMGSPATEQGRYDDEGPVHQVTLTKGFWLGETPCTQELWQAVTGSNPSEFLSPRRPVETVSWDDAQKFLEALGRKVTGLKPRLPSEAWWEYACRAGTATATWRGDLEILGERNAPGLDAIAWYGGNSGVGFDLEEGRDSSQWEEKQYPHGVAGTREVGLKGPNPWGLYDMLGNVEEWCSDYWSEYLEESQVDPTGPRGGPGRVVRGGSWYALARRVRAASRDWLPPDGRYSRLGFRLSLGQGL